MKSGRRFEDRGRVDVRERRRRREGGFRRWQRTGRERVSPPEIESGFDEILDENRSRRRLIEFVVPW
jgi:hypothetical protein